MNRRAILLALAALPLRGADAATQVWDVLTNMASALASGDAPGFLSYFDRHMKSFEDLSSKVAGLVAEAEISSAIDPVQNTGNDQNRTLEVTWSMHLVSRSQLEIGTQRQATATIGMERQRGKWKVVSFEPVSLFQPPSARV